MQDNPYLRAKIALVTKHGKAAAVASPFHEILGAEVIEYNVDTDLLGTFTGEFPRNGSPIDCARQKCRMAAGQPGFEFEYVLSSEGSFGPHPYIPFAACDHEILYFVDLKRDFSLHMSRVDLNTNYKAEPLRSQEDLYRFAATAGFPAHAIILRSADNEPYQKIVKGLASREQIYDAFHDIMMHSQSRTVMAQTDMRAFCNPSRMAVIGMLAKDLASRLARACPECLLPGFGQKGLVKGLPCTFCATPTEMIKSEIHGCVKCDFKTNIGRSDHLAGAPREFCPTCNP